MGFVCTNKMIVLLKKKKTVCSFRGLQRIFLFLFFFFLCFFFISFFQSAASFFFGSIMLAAVENRDAKKLAELMKQDPGFNVNMVPWFRMNMGAPYCTSPAREWTVDPP